MSGDRAPSLQLVARDPILEGLLALVKESLPDYRLRISAAAAHRRWLESMGLATEPCSDDGSAPRRSIPVHGPNGDVVATLDCFGPPLASGVSSARILELAAKQIAMRLDQLDGARSSNQIPSQAVREAGDNFRQAPRAEQMVLQEALQESLGAFGTLVASLPVGIALSHGRRLRYANQALVKMLGYARASELEGRDISELIHPRSERMLLERQANMARGRYPGPAIYECRRQDGTLALVEATSIPSAFEGKPAILAIIRDITEATWARRAQELSEQRFRTLVTMAPVGIFETNLEGKCVYANEQACNLLGLPLDQFLGDGWLSAVHPDDLEQLRALRASARESVSAVRHELRFVNAGKTVFARVEAAPLQTDGALSGFLGAMVDLTALHSAQDAARMSLLRDVTELEKACAERDAAHAALVESLKQKETLFQEVHHRVKNNLQVIVSLLRLGRGYVKDAGSLAIFNDSIARLHSIALIHERLYKSSDLAKIDMQDYLRDLVTQLLRASSTHQRPSADIRAEGVFLNMDECVPLGLIVNELVSNALKHAFNGSLGESQSIQVTLLARAEDYELVVSDNGVGMTAGATHESSLGVRLVVTLTKQLSGQHSIETHPGTRWRIVFPKGPEAQLARALH